MTLINIFKSFRRPCTILRCLLQFPPVTCPRKDGRWRRKTQVIAQPFNNQLVCVWGRMLLSAVAAAASSPSQKNKKHVLAYLMLD